jgi:hypothetical protein
MKNALAIFTFFAAMMATQVTAAQEKKGPAPSPARYPLQVNQLASDVKGLWKAFKEGRVKVLREFDINLAEFKSKEINRTVPITHKTFKLDSGKIRKKASMPVREFKVDLSGPEAGGSGGPYAVLIETHPDYHSPKGFSDIVGHYPTAALNNTPVPYAPNDGLMVFNAKTRTWRPIGVHGQPNTKQSAVFEQNKLVALRNTDMIGIENNKLLIFGLNTTDTTIYGQDRQIATVYVVDLGAYRTKKGSVGGM